ncbi:MAG: methyl-accepting chemotaxis protein [Paucimonas sp.]|jgi:methyl-accepting chemotaxis protein|nr:methyl-accepting chemotaxis protein [Paucimonas sp.]
MKNLSVRLKLLLSLFPLVLLAALLALTAILSLGSLTHRAERLVSVNYILDSLNDIRSAQMAYALDQQPEDLNDLRQALAHMDTLIDENLAHMPFPEAQDKLGSTRSLMAEYLQRLEQHLENGATALVGHNGKQLVGQVLAAIEQINALITLQNQVSADEFSQRTRLMLALFGATLILACLVAWLLIRQICSPLQEALDLAQRIGQGDLRQPALTPRSDEFGQLLQALGRSCASLRGIVQSLGQVSTRLRQTSGTLAATVEHTSDGATRQQSETLQVATAMSQMAGAVQEIAQNSALASQATDQASDRADFSRQVVRDTQQQIVRLAEDIEGSTQAVQQLSEGTEQIGSIMTVIHAVAEQTNLLALNAAIEAARAGDAGRGFAVVADEVRSLAQRTQRSTSEIEALVGSLQEGARHAVERMHGSRDAAGHSVALANQASEALQVITTNVDDIQGMNQQIAASTEQQSVMVSTIRGNMDNVRDVAEQALRATRDIEAATDELGHLDQELEGLIGSFRL